jgi:hypothetical protein
MLDKKAVREFLDEELGEVEVPDDIFEEALAEAFCKYVEDDYYEWLKDNFKSFFNYGKPDWQWVRERIEKLRLLKKIIKSPRYPQIIPQNKNT